MKEFYKAALDLEYWGNNATDEELEYYYGGMKVGYVVLIWVVCIEY